MWLKNACVIKKIPINNAAAAGSDPNVAGFIEKATQTLGKKGRFVIKLSGIPQENSVLAEGKSERLCNHCIEEFEKLLIRKGYMDHEHVWETLQETDYGEMDYNSYGGGVEHFVVTLYRCRLCGALHKECRGDFCGDPEEYLEIFEAVKDARAELDDLKEHPEEEGAEESASCLKDFVVHKEKKLDAWL